MGMTILGLGTATPRVSVDQDQAATAARAFVFGDGLRAQAVPGLFRATQIRRRGSVLLEPPDGKPVQQSFYPPALGPEDRGPTTGLRMERYSRETPPLAMAAAAAAVREAGLPPAEITHLVTISCTGFTAPGVDRELMMALRLSPAVARIHIGFMGCHAAVNGLRVAQALVDADPAAKVLLAAVELCSLHSQYGDRPQALVANALFADGAAALIGANSRTGSGGRLEVAATGSYLLPDSADAMTWRIGDHGFEMSLSPCVPDLIARHLRPWLEAWLARRGLMIHEVGGWGVHPGGPRILTCVATALGLPDAALATSAEVLSDHGNMSSPTVLFVLQRLWTAGIPRPYILLAFGPGLIVEAALLGDGPASLPPGVD